MRSELPATRGNQVALVFCRDDSCIGSRQGTRLNEPEDLFGSEMEDLGRDSGRAIPASWEVLG